MGATIGALAQVDIAKVDALGHLGHIHWVLWNLNHGCDFDAPTHQGTCMYVYVCTYMHYM